MTYFKDVYNAISPSIELVCNNQKQRKQDPRFDVELIQTESPVEDGFYLKCDNILWHVRWNGIKNYVEAFQDGRQVTGYNNVNNSAKTSAQRLIEDIHRTKLMSMPEYPSHTENVLKKLHLR